METEENIPGLENVSIYAGTVVLGLHWCSYKLRSVSG